MRNQFNDVSCEDLRELATESPEEAQVIMEMLKAAGEKCPEMDAATGADATSR